MKSLDPRLLVAGGVLAAAFVGGVAFGPALTLNVAAQVPGGVATQLLDHGPFGGHGLFAAAAQYIGISESDLRTEMGATKSLSDVAVAHGKTRDGLIQALTQAAQQDIATLVDHKGFPQGPGPRGFGPGHPGPMGIFGDDFAAAAQYLGISESDLRTKLQAGNTSLAQIANATPGKSRDGLIAALVGDATAKIQQAQKDGKLTADQANQIISGLNGRITRLVDATGFFRGPGPRR